MAGGGADRALRRRIAAMSPAERQAILAASPLEAGLYQGQGWFVFRKGVADTDAAFVAALEKSTARPPRTG